MSTNIRKLTSFSNEASMNECYPHTVRRRDLTHTLVRKRENDGNESI
jgi:hypothetical protein